VGSQSAVIICPLVSSDVVNNAVAPSKMKEHFTATHYTLACKNLANILLLMQQNYNQAKSVTSSM
jgi:hypothetical protein